MRRARLHSEGSDRGREVSGAAGKPREAGQRHTRSRKENHGRKEKEDRGKGREGGLALS